MHETINIKYMFTFAKVDVCIVCVCVCVYVYVYECMYIYVLCIYRILEAWQVIVKTCHLTINTDTKVNCGDKQWQVSFHAVVKWKGLVLFALYSAIKKPALKFSVSPEEVRTCSLCCSYIQISSPQYVEIIVFFTNTMHKFFILIHLLHSSTCFEHCYAHPQEVKLY